MHGNTNVASKTGCNSQEDRAINSGKDARYRMLSYKLVRDGIYTAIWVSVEIHSGNSVLDTINDGWTCRERLKSFIIHV